MSVYKKNQLIWAKVRGFSWWPAVVKESNKKADGTIVNNVRVIFLQENKIGSVPLNKILHYEDNYEKLSKAKNKKLQEAIQIADEEVKKKKVFVGEGNGAPKKGKNKSKKETEKGNNEEGDEDTPKKNIRGRPKKKRDEKEEGKGENEADEDVNTAEEEKKEENETEINQSAIEKLSKIKQKQKKKLEEKGEDLENIEEILNRRSTRSRTKGKSLPEYELAPVRKMRRLNPEHALEGHDNIIQNAEHITETEESKKEDSQGKGDKGDRKDLEDNFDDHHINDNGDGFWSLINKEDSKNDDKKMEEERQEQKNQNERMQVEKDGITNENEESSTQETDKTLPKKQGKKVLAQRNNEEENIAKEESKRSSSKNKKKKGKGPTKKTVQQKEKPLLDRLLVAIKSFESHLESKAKNNNISNGISSSYTELSHILTELNKNSIPEDTLKIQEIVNHLGGICIIFNQFESIFDEKDLNLFDQLFVLFPMLKKSMQSQKENHVMNKNNSFSLNKVPLDGTTLSHPLLQRITARKEACQKFSKLLQINYLLETDAAQDTALVLEGIINRYFVKEIDYKRAITIFTKLLKLQALELDEIESSFTMKAAQFKAWLKERVDNVITSKNLRN